MATVGYNSIEEALASIKVSYTLVLIKHDWWDSYKVKVSAPLHKNKEYYLPNTYSTDFKGIHEDVLQILAIKYGIGSDTFYYIQ